MVDFPEPDINFIERWLFVVQRLDIPEEAYKSEVRVIYDKSRKFDFTFGAILNENRSKRPFESQITKLNCPLCEVVKDAKKDAVRNLDSESELEGYIVTANLFPISLGHSMIISNGVGKDERPVYNTKTLNHMADEFDKMFEYGTSKALQVFQNGEGAGATIPNHQHTHLTNWYATFAAADRVYGFEDADVKHVRRTSVSIMPGFPFAHLIFKQNDSERIVSFLESLGNYLSDRYKRGFIPHVLCQGRQGILVAPFKRYLDKESIGSGDVAGHIVFKDRARFKAADYGFCVRKLGKQMFMREEISLTQFL